MNFRTQYGEHEKFFSDPGSPIKISYGLKYDQAGCVGLDEKGKINLYDEIQSHADSVDINVILKRFACGDESVLNQRFGDFMDCTALPKTYAELLNVVVNAEDMFNSLPSEIRSEFNNSVAQFIAGMDQPDFAARVNGSVQSKADIGSGEKSSEGEAV